MPPGLLARHGAAMARHARPVVLIALLLTVGGYLVAALGVGGPSLFSRLAVGEPTVSGEALTGRELLAENDPTGLAVQGLWSGIDPTSPQVQAALAEANADLATIPGVLQVLDATTIGPAAISVDGRSTLTTVVLEKELSGAEEEAATAAASERLAEMADAAAGSTLELTGSALLYGTITDQVKKDLI
jgi:hypothetical protein